MKKEIVWLLASCLMVAALLLASCAPADVEEEKEKEETAPAVTGPQYGGTHNFVVAAKPELHPYNRGTVYSTWANVYQPLVMDDWAKGPSGTGKHLYSSPYFPWQQGVAGLCESWEIVDLQTIIWHVNPDVRWQDKAPVNGRELTAEDLVWSIENNQTYPRGLWFSPPDTPAEETWQATVIDKYTFEVKAPKPDIMMTYRFAFDMLHGPREVEEMAEGGTAWEDWKNAVGTGPFILTDYVADSSLTFERNPDYWEMDALNPGNQLPYVDKAVGLVMLDPATYQAALRTAQVDRLSSIGWEQKDSLVGAQSDLLFRAQAPGDTEFFPNNDEAPWNNYKVRRALTMAINYDEIIDDYFKGNSVLLTYPTKEAYGRDIWCGPLESASASIQELFTYDPEKARKILDEEGFPESTEITIMTQNFMTDRVQIVASMWEKIGIEVIIDERESGTYWDIALAKTGPDMIALRYNASHPLSHHGASFAPDHVWNFATTPADQLTEVVALYDEVSKELDPVKRNAKIKELSCHIIDNAFYIPIPQPLQYVIWWPWLKGHSGEFASGCAQNMYGPMKYYWIDEDLKNELGH